MHAKDSDKSLLRELASHAKAQFNLGETDVSFDVILKILSVFHEEASRQSKTLGPFTIQPAHDRGLSIIFNSLYSNRRVSVELVPDCWVSKKKDSSFSDDGMDASHNCIIHHYPSISSLKEDSEGLAQWLFSEGDSGLV